MRTTDERLAAAKRRAEEIKRQERSRRSRIAAVSGAAACLAAILGLALTMPSVTARFSGADYYGGMTASLFSGESLGYLLVGLLAFTLGTLYWTLHLLLRQETPQVFYVSDLAWLASFVFLLALTLTLPTAEERRLLSRRWSTRCGPPRASG